MPATSVPNHKQLLYEPIILEHALKESCRSHRILFSEPTAKPKNNLETQRQAFQSFVDKLSQVCDNRRGGDTVTSFAILKGRDGPKFVFGSNARNHNDLIEAQEFVQNLVEFVGENPEKLKEKPLTKRVLWRILLFNLPRVQAYLEQLSKSLKDCIKDSYRRQRSQTSSSELKRLDEVTGELRLLKEKAEFPQDIASSSLQDKFLSDCEKLIKAILAIKNTSMDKAIRDNAKDGDLTSSEAWCELRHYLGRLLSFRQAAEVIVGASDRFKSMFKDFKVIAVPSSDRILKPIPKSSLVTAASIIRNMASDDEDMQALLANAADMQKLGLDEFIRIQLCKRTFRPYVHAEILVHDYLLRHAEEECWDYWNGWEYIGGSKPTCRLCHYYFTSHPNKVPVRDTHFNLYPNWRLPGMFENNDTTVSDARSLELLRKIIDSVRDDAKDTLEKKSPRGKKHDSDTHSTVPVYYKYINDDSISLGDAPSRVPRILLRSQSRNGTYPTVDDDDGFSMVGEIDPEETDDENGGVTVLSGYL
ncbi:hypothetical protein CkaCkLH20_10048 [Colletotrichum karsti]|uniref:Uncharacterized protein n=1 Tax=Colletotrichum karsti TaxID=1095194 RepID=A0A9P6LGU2_9PEZI|nr:uncharacterized protein CkaCkLH20_10048 [Colletotrichum karsti]KAF9872551.1 hypothetical protein CkaCkLH20_10048 [Colletotrichum karsti]